MYLKIGQRFIVALLLGMTVGAMFGMVLPARAEETNETINNEQLTTTSTTDETGGMLPTSTPNEVTSTPEQSDPPTQESTTTIQQLNNLTISVNLNLRYQNQLIFSGTVEIPSTTNITDANNVIRSTTSTNVLTALIAADALSDNFSISNLQYYDSWGSYYLKCLNALAVASTSLCDSWNYVVNNNYPSLGMDGYNLSGGENIYIYFDNPWKISIPSSTVYLNTTTTLFTWRYDFDHLENNWLADANEITISSPNPAPTGWWDTDISVATINTDINGQAEYMFTSTGTFSAKVSSADYSKWSWPVNIIVTTTSAIFTDVTTTPDIATTTPPISPPSGHDEPTFDLAKALDFLSDNLSNKILNNNLLTDWSAIAFGANGESEAKNIIKAYLIAHTDVTGGLNSVSDNARRAMALMALGVNPYSGTAVNYISAITAQFDGAQFGDVGLFNDDIFALIPLIKAGVNLADPMVAHTVQFILSKQNANGSFGDVDMTAAAAQALGLAGQTTAQNNALNYLKSTQLPDGSFPGPTPAISTAWAAQALAGQSGYEQAKQYLATRQGPGGGLEQAASDLTRVWTTAYAIPAVLGKNWGEILMSFSSPVLATPPGYSPDTVATSTELTTTTLETLIITSSTAEVVTTSEKISNYQFLISKQFSISNSKISNSKIVNRKSLIIIHQSSTPPATDSSTTLSASAPRFVQNDTNDVPLDTPTRRAVKKILALSGGSTVAVGLYLGLKFMRGVV